MAAPIWNVTMLQLMAAAPECAVSCRKTALKVTTATCGTQRAASPQVMRQTSPSRIGPCADFDVVADWFTGAVGAPTGGSRSHAQAKAAVMKQRAAMVA